MTGRSASLSGFDMAQIRVALGSKQEAAESAFWDVRQHRLGVSAKQGHRSGYWRGVQDVLTLQLAIGELSQGELLAELRKESGSVFWPLLVGDPKIPAECPRCERRVVIDKEGLCPWCAYEFEED
ncbi:hypothetical protein [Microbacterium sp. 5K110]|jgi:hypothetical protein|uniref:hypothetical protein n=1 Tax=Microbacterium sp. 5K110 TaxID=2578104 RepID=UPI0010FE1A20|nr:hypothetical protein [Microbacterium sp. 5K110]TLF33265.1 hypothetical protein FE256_04000 [Microbacterium sp. 5K110]